jgi:PKD repeat protein
VTAGSRDGPARAGAGNENPRSGFRRDTRSVATTVNYVLAIALTTILVSSLLVSASGYVDDRRERAVRAELETVGSALAADVAEADRLSQQGRNVTLRMDQPEVSTADSYTAAVTTDCPTVETCLRLRSAGPSVTVVVPVANETPLSLGSTVGGWRITADGSALGTTDVPPTGTAGPNIGIGRGVSGRPSPGDTVDPTNRAPIPGFAHEPYIPFPNETITFVNDTADLDGNLDSFTWDFGDGSGKTSGGVVTHSYAEPGRYTVTLTATDTEGATANVSKQVVVSGLVYNDDALAFDVDNDGYQGGVSFSVHNDFDDPVYVEDVLVDPRASTADVGSLSDRDDRKLTSDGTARDSVEVYVGGNDAAWVDYGQDGDTDTTAGMSLESGGKLVALTDDQTSPRIETDDERARINQNSDATIEFTEFRENVSMVGRNITVGLRYTVNGTHYASRFVIEPISGPNAEFGFAPGAPQVGNPVTFNAAGSDDPQGSITSFEWSFGDGATGTGQTVNHNYTAPGLYVVELTVTDDDGYQDSTTRLVFVEDDDIVWAANVNGGEYTSQDGIRYEALPSGSDGWSTTRPVADTQDDYVYRTGERNYYGDLTYSESIPDGTYEVTLKFNDPYDVNTYGGVGVEIEGDRQVYYRDVDQEAGGYDTAYDLTFTVDVENGLTVTIEGRNTGWWNGHATLSGIVVREAGGGQPQYVAPIDPHARPAVQPPPSAPADGSSAPRGGGSGR